MPSLRHAIQMRIIEARARAEDWLRRHVTGPEIRGAFFSGSSITARAEDQLDAHSDVDVVVVVSGDPPAKLGKIMTQDLVMDVSYLSLADLIDPAAVARTFYLAPSFRDDSIILDPSGHLRRVHDHVRRVFADPEVVRARYLDVLQRMDVRMAAVADARSWTEQMLLWLFAASLPTQVLLVAGLRPPTVRLRYRANRELVGDHGMPGVYRELLAQLGAESLPPEAVRDQLTRLPAVFDAAARTSQVSATFPGELGPAGREVALAGAERLIAAGDHREAVFWLAVTFLRSQLILDAEAGTAVAARHCETVHRAVAALTGVHNADDLAARTARVARARPGLLDTAETLIAGSR